MNRRTTWIRDLSDQLITIQLFKSTVLQQFMVYEVSLLCSH